VQNFISFSKAIEFLRQYKEKYTKIFRRRERKQWQDEGNYVLKYRPCFVKERQIKKYQFYWRSKRTGSVLRIKNALRGRILSTYLGNS
jgi:hypothetical protein